MVKKNNVRGSSQGQGLTIPFQQQAEKSSQVDPAGTHLLKILSPPTNTTLDIKS